MAKKTVAGYREKSEGRSYSKVIKMVKSPKTGALRDFQIEYKGLDMSNM
jgi:hypothetical protein